MWSGALDSSDLLLPYPRILLASPMTCQYTNIHPHTKHTHLYLCRIVPSVVAYLRSGVEVGERARRQQVVNPLNTFASIKRVIGQRKSDIDSGSNNRKNKDTNKDLSGGIAGEGDETDVDEDLRKRGPEVLLACPTLDRSVSPVEVSAEIIRNLLRAAESHLGTGEGSVTKAVITVPAYFLPDQCAATEEAGCVMRIGWPCLELWL